MLNKFVDMTTRKPSGWFWKKKSNMKEEENKLPDKMMDSTVRQNMLLIAILIFVTAVLVAPSSAAANANIVITDVTPTSRSL
jgi:hypothetical protein